MRCEKEVGASQELQRQPKAAGEGGILLFYRASMVDLNPRQGAWHLCLP